MSISPTAKFLSTLHKDSSIQVYRDHRSPDGRYTLVKTSVAEFPEHEDIASLEQEYAILRHLDGEGALKAYTLAWSDLRLNLLLEDVAALPLSALAAERDFFVDSFLHIGAAIADALGRIHAKGVFVGDIAANTIFYEPQTGRALFVGLAWARFMENGVAPQEARLPLARLHHLAPELFGRLRRAPDWRSDLYALGVTFYDLLTGCVPFTGTDPLTLLHAHMTSEPVPPHLLKESIPAAVSDILLKLLAKDPEDRYQSAFGLKADLEECRRLLAANGQAASFVPGGHDFCDFFHLSERLYGREKECLALRAATERLKAGGRELIFVSGYSGIGKTALVEELRRPVAAMGGRFVSGKYDALHRSEPFSALIDALRGLVRDVLSEQEVVQEAWGGRLRGGLANVGQVLVDLIPEIEALIGPQPPVPQVPPRETKGRLAMAVMLFLRAMSSIDHPLALFLDDLQWADAASLNLLENILLKAEISAFLCVGAYRDNEVDAGHLLLLTHQALQAGGIEPTAIRLGPIDVQATTAFLADTLHTPLEQTRGLADVLHCQTWGNPFFLRQMLTFLHAEGSITFAPDQRRWEWDLDGIADQGLTVNVAELLARKISQSPRATLEILCLAACMGNVFDLTALTRLVGSDKHKVLDALGPALRSGFLYVVPQAQMSVWSEADAGDAQTLAFVHDHVREAATGLWSEGERCAAHKRIAVMLLANLPPRNQDQRVFEITDHCNRAIGAFDSPEQRKIVAEWNLKACVKARLSTAFATALSYAKQGMELLPADIWTVDYKFALEYHKERGLLEQLNMNFEEAEIYNIQGIEKSTTLIERYYFVTLRINQKCMEGKIGEAIEDTKKELNFNGINVPDDHVEVMVQEYFDEILALMARKRPEDYIDVIPMPDMQLAAACSIINGVAPATYFYDRTLLALWGAILVRFTLTHGYTSGTYPALGSFGRLVVSLLGDYQLGYEFGQLGLNLCRKHNATPLLPSIISTFADTAFFFEPVSSLYALLKEGIQAAFVSGDPYHVELLQAIRLCFNYHLGRNLKEMIEEIVIMKSSREKHHSIIALSLSNVLYFASADLVDASVSEDFRAQEDQFIANAGATGLTSALAYYHGLKGMSHYILRQLDNMRDHFNKAREYGSEREWFLGCEYMFHRTLAVLAFPGEWQAEPGELAREIEENRGHLRTWAMSCPETFLPRHLLLEAELARVNGEPLATVLDLYDCAAEAAKASGCTHLLALTEELTGRFWISQGRQTYARPHLFQAVQTYRTWGAQRKAQDLAQEYEALFGGAESSLPTDEGEADILLNALDFHSLIKAAGAISGEITLPRLAATLTQLAAENAGAQACLLAITRGAGLCVLTGAGARLEPNTPLREVPLDVFQNGPAAILRLVAEKRTPLLLDDAASDIRFLADDYVVRVQPRSILCVPIARKEKLLGVIYLENNLIRGAFTEQRVEAVTLLAAQAAISLENALLYEELRKAEAQYRAIFENALEGIIRFSVDGRILLLNPAAATILGYPSPDAAMAAATDYRSQLFLDSSQCDTLHESLSRDQLVSRREIRMTRPDGRIIWVLFSATPMRDADGQFSALEGVLIDISQRKDAEAQVHRLNNELLRIQENERNRIALDLHDDVCQNLLVAKLCAARLFTGFPELETSETFHNRQEELTGVLQGVLVKIRDLSHDLRPPNLDQVGLVRALYEVCVEISDRAGLAVDFQAAGTEGLQVDYDTQINLYRLVQEALNNIAKHAHARTVILRIIASYPVIRLWVEDDGCGFDPNAQDSCRQSGRYMGLSTMRERARLVGGRCDITSRPGAGTKISLEFPYPKGEQ